MEIGVAIDVPYNGDQRLRIHERFKRNIDEFKLTFARNHDAVQSLLYQRTISANAQLAAKHHVESVRPGTAGFVSELQPDNAALFTGLLFELIGNVARQAAVQIN